eukprot:TRINITY_DN7127_c0_g1_i18.p1 TRINITY_DN7127_c0_g1~~TRINITY_DN7127_c0_g1_i18.p1  ORF type:complete len:103 (+),score=2.18 TRINITY_DN7127_c0_g1_i18:730-1038(+)
MVLSSVAPVFASNKPLINFSNSGKSALLSFTESRFLLIVSTTGFAAAANSLARASSARTRANSAAYASLRFFAASWIDVTAAANSSTLWSVYGFSVTPSFTA